MFSVVINDKKYVAEEGTPLKELLVAYGMAFPCGGVGRCGQCRIVCPALQPTEKDKRFLSEQNLTDGIRLACDKIIRGDVVLTCPQPTETAPKRELLSCNIVASIQEDFIDVGICDDALADTVTLPNPLAAYGSLSEQAEAYKKEPSKLSNLLRGVIGKESVEFFEKFGKAKAETTALCGNGFYLKILLGVPQETFIEDYNVFIGENSLSLPTESIYILPVENEMIGGDLFCETVRLAENSLVMDCQDVCNILYIDKDTTTACSMWDMDYSEIGLLAIRAAIRVLRPQDSTPLVYLYGKNAYRLEEILTAEGLNFIHKSKDFNALVQACNSARFRAKLEKERSRTSVRNLLKDEDFQEQMNVLSTL